MNKQILSACCNSLRDCSGSSLYKDLSPVYFYQRTEKVVLYVPIARACKRPMFETIGGYLTHHCMDLTCPLTNSSGGPEGRNGDLLLFAQVPIFAGGGRPQELPDQFPCNGWSNKLTCCPLRCDGH